MSSTFVRQKIRVRRASYVIACNQARGPNSIRQLRMTQASRLAVHSASLCFGRRWPGLSPSDPEIILDTVSPSLTLSFNKILSLRRRTMFLFSLTSYILSLYFESIFVASTLKKLPIRKNEHTIDVIFTSKITKINFTHKNNLLYNWKANLYLKFVPSLPLKSNK